jgi:hypothetical protein
MHLLSDEGETGAELEEEFADVCEEPLFHVPLGNRLPKREEIEVVWIAQVWRSPGGKQAGVARLVCAVAVRPVDEKMVCVGEVLFLRWASSPAEGLPAWLHEFASARTVPPPLCPTPSATPRFGTCFAPCARKASARGAASCELARRKHGVSQRIVSTWLSSELDARA